MADLSIAKPRAMPKVISYRKVKDIDIDALCVDISNSKLGKPTGCSDLNELVSDYNSTLADLLDHHAPLLSKKVVERPNTPWYTSDISSAKRDCRKAERRWRCKKLEVHRQLYVSSLHNLQMEIENSKKHYYKTKIEECDQKSIYKISNSLMNKSTFVSLPAFSSAANLATRFNKFFVDKIVKIREDLQSISLDLKNLTTNPTSYVFNIYKSYNPPTLSEFMPATEIEIKKIIMASKTTQCALDPIPTRLLKTCINALLPSLTKIVNLSLSTGVMPAALKKALVVPLLKKLNLNTEMLKNFRPVSNLAFLSKLIERVVAARIKHHMDTNNLHEVLQSSYKRFHSCETALLKVKDDILQEIDNNKCVLLVLLDLSAAFDTVDHEKLIKILAEKIGLAGAALKWFRDYLLNRIQSVIIDGVESNIWNILFGVPQGSVLGPILFIIYTSPLGDIFRHHGVSYHLYADDTQIYISFSCDKLPDAFTRMEQCIADIRCWMTSNLLKLNDDKTEVLLIGSKSHISKLQKVHLIVGNDTIVPADAARNVGVVFDSTMAMDKHVSTICKGAWHHLRQLGKIRQYLDTRSAAVLIHSYVTSRLDNFNSLLYGLPKYEIDRIQRIQNAAARVVSLTRKYDHITPVLQGLHWLPVIQRINFKILLLTFKALHEMAPTYISSLLKVSNNSRSLRSNSKFLLTLPRTRSVKYGDASFSHAAPFLWNKLPDECRMATSINDFKSKVKTFLFRQAFNL
jgi:hypothetical protein